jgi:hypothetical protein
MEVTKAFTNFTVKKKAMLVTWSIINKILQFRSLSAAGVLHCFERSGTRNTPWGKMMMMMINCLFGVLYTSAVCKGARGSVVGRSTMLQAGWSRVRFPMPMDFINWPNPSSRTMALGSTQPLAEMSSGIFLGGKGRPARKADHLNANC